MEEVVMMSKEKKRQKRGERKELRGKKGRGKGNDGEKMK